MDPSSQVDWNMAQREWEEDPQSPFLLLEGNDTPLLCCCSYHSRYISLPVSSSLFFIYYFEEKGGRRSNRFGGERERDFRLCSCSYTTGFLLLSLSVWHWKRSREIYLQYIYLYIYIAEGVKGLCRSITFSWLPPKERIARHEPYTTHQALNLL